MKGAFRSGTKDGRNLPYDVEREETKRWPTPVTTDAKGSRRNTASTSAWKSNPGDTLLDAVWIENAKLYPTPTASRYGSTNNGNPGDEREKYATAGTPSLDTIATREWGGALNPTWVEALMGAPAGWTAGPHAAASLSTRGSRRAPSPSKTSSGGRA